MLDEPRLVETKEVQDCFVSGWFMDKLGQLICTKHAQYSLAHSFVGDIRVNCKIFPVYSLGIEVTGYNKSCSGVLIKFCLEFSEGKF